MTSKWPVSRYKGEYNSYNQMKRRCEENGQPLHEQFETFSQFMEVLGPKPDASFTLDRLDPNDPEYAPDKVRWASKSEQANNRRNTLFLTYTGSRYPDWTGERKPLSTWSARIGVKMSTMRARLNNGWTPDDAIEGQRTSEKKPFHEMKKAELLSYSPWSRSDVESEQRYLAEHNDQETRLEFYARVLTAEPVEIAHRHLSKIAWYSEGTPRLQAGEVKRGPWIKRSESDPELFDLRYEDWRQAMLTSIDARKAKEAWRDALHKIIARRAPPTPRQIEKRLANEWNVRSEEGPRSRQAWEDDDDF